MFQDSDLSNIITAQLVTAVKQQRFKPFIISKGSSKTLFLQLNQPPSSNLLTVYQQEQSNFGKAIRLLVHLNDAYALSNILSQQRIENVIVTEASIPQLSNRSNTSTLPASFIQDIFNQLKILKGHNSDIVETAIQTLIDENQNL